MIRSRSFIMAYHAFWKSLQGHHKVSREHVFAGLFSTLCFCYIHTSTCFLDHISYLCLSNNILIYIHACFTVSQFWSYFQERVHAKAPPYVYLDQLRTYLDPRSSRSSRVVRIADSYTSHTCHAVSTISFSSMYRKL